MPTQALSTVLIVAIVLIWAIGRQVLPRRVTRVPFVVLPIVGLFEMTRYLPHPTIPANQLAECVVSVLLSAVAGLLQGLVTNVYTAADGQVYMRGGWKYLVLWLGLIATRLIVGFLFNGASFHYESVLWIIWADLAVVWGVRGILLYTRYPEIRTQLANASANRRARRLG